MPEFEVLIKRKLWQTGAVVVEAETRNDAKDKARRMGEADLRAKDAWTLGEVEQEGPVRAMSTRLTD